MPLPREARLDGSVAAATECAEVGRRRARRSAARREDDIRRKILVGAWVPDPAERNPQAAQKRYRGLDAYLKADRDRVPLDLQLQGAD